jgi:hypothetical protein
MIEYKSYSFNYSNTKPFTSPNSLEIEVGDDQILIVMVCQYDTGYNNRYASSISWNGTSMTLAKRVTYLDDGYWRHISVFYLVNPSQGTYTPNISYNGGTHTYDGASCVMSSYFNGCNIDNPIGETVATGNSKNSTITTKNNNSLIVGCAFFINPSHFLTSLSSGSSQTEIYKRWTSSGWWGDGFISGYLSKEIAGSQSFNWNVSAAGGTTRSSSVVIEINSSLSSFIPRTMWFN